MICASYGHITPKRRNVDSSLLMHGTPSIRKTGQKWFGLSGMSVPVPRSLPLTDTVTGHSGGAGHEGWVRSIFAEQVGCDPGGPLRHDCIWHRGTPYHQKAPGRTPCVTQLWFADDAGAAGKFGHILEHFQDLRARGPPRGYLPEPNKSILVVAPQNVARAEEFVQGMGMKIVTESWYLGDFVGYRAAKDN